MFQTNQMLEEICFDETLLNIATRMDSFQSESGEITTVLIVTNNNQLDLFLQ